MTTECAESVIIEEFNRLVRGLPVEFAIDLAAALEDRFNVIRDELEEQQ